MGTTNGRAAGCGFDSRRVHYSSNAQRSEPRYRPVKARAPGSGRRKPFEPRRRRGSIARLRRLIGPCRSMAGRILGKDEKRVRFPPGAPHLDFEPSRRAEGLVSLRKFAGAQDRCPSSVGGEIRFTTTRPALSQTGDVDSVRRVSGLVLRRMMA